MWSSHREQHREWRGKVAEAKERNNTKWLGKLLQREPQRPFTNGMRHKIPIWFDRRIGSIEPSRNITLTQWVARISTLKKGERITLPLNPAQYHLDLLTKGKLKSFQLVRGNEHYHVHVKVEYEAPDQPAYTVRGTDLGIKRTAATVTIHPDKSLSREDFTTITDGEKRHRLNRLNRRTSELQKAEQWEPLKRLRHKRLNVATNYDRLTAKQLADQSNNSLVVIGHPKGIKYSSYRGNGKRKLRKHLAGWAYGRAIRFIREECNERGIRVETPEEWWSSRTCPKCHSRNTERPTQSLLHCWDCETWYNADYAAGINLGSPFLPAAMVRRGADDSPQAEDDQPREIVGCELGRSPRASAVGEVTASVVCQ